jgi:hypothetical protein
MVLRTVDEKRGLVYEYLPGERDKSPAMYDKYTATPAIGFPSPNSTNSPKLDKVAGGFLLEAIGGQGVLR